MLERIKKKTDETLGKLNRGMSVVDTFEILKGSELDEGEYFSAAVLGWCVELVSPTSVQASCKRVIRAPRFSFLPPVSFLFPPLSSVSALFLPISFTSCIPLAGVNL